MFVFFMYEIYGLLGWSLMDELDKNEFSIMKLLSKLKLNVE